VRTGLVAAALALIGGCSGDDIAQPLDYETDVVTRSAWGWTDSEIASSRHTISRITIHHGGVEFADDRDPVEYLRSLQKWSRTDKGWPDIPYHFVVDLDGNIYEARPLDIAGDTNTSYDPSGHALIVVTGNYDNRELSTRQLESVAALAAYVASEYSVALQDIKGHRDYAPAETSCPGADIYRYLEDGTLHRRIETIINLSN
jgi:hypothetical protein